MTRPRKAPDDPHERLAEAIEHLAERLIPLQDAIDDIRTELNYAVTNAKHIYVMPHVLPRNPTGPRWNQRLEALNDPVKTGLQKLLECAELNQDSIEPETRKTVERLHALLNRERPEEEVACMECATTLPLADAVRGGWEEIYSDEGGIVGMCPSCLRCEDRRVEAKSKPKDTIHCTECETIVPGEPGGSDVYGTCDRCLGKAALAEKIEDFELWKTEVRDAAAEFSEGVRQVRVQGAVAEYEIGRTRDGKWAVQIRCVYEIGDQSGASSPWMKKETREECVELFLTSAKYHFGLKTEERQQRVQKEMLKLLVGEGLFGFVEPDPFPRAKVPPMPM